MWLKDPVTSPRQLGRHSPVKPDLHRIGTERQQLDTTCVKGATAVA